MVDNSDTNPAATGTRFPFISLEKALNRAKQLFDADQKGREMTLAGAFAVWEYSEKSSGGFQTIAALKMYGLLKASNGSDTRKMALSESALRYFREEREEEKIKIAREFALKPKLIAALWLDWGATPPADAIARSHLKADRALTDQGARSLLSIYKENLTFTEITSQSKVDKQEPEVPGETVHKQPSHDFFGDMFTNFGRPRQKQGQPVQQSPSSNPQKFAGGPVPSLIPEGMRREIITLDEGDVVITFPDGLTPESFGDLKDHLDLFIKKMQRRSVPKGDAEASGEES